MQPGDKVLVRGRWPGVIVKVYDDGYATVKFPIGNAVSSGNIPLADIEPNTDPLA